MGVTTLWNILSRVSKPVSLDDLRGQTIAIDLSIWLCANPAALQGGAAAKHHIRTLFWRISQLLSHQIRPVVVLDGPSPKLKDGAIAKRIIAKSGSPIKKWRQCDDDSPKVRECCELLELLGVPYVRSKGDAEALMAQLNADGVVDGCITDDSDAFLFGAKVVYRNFTANRNGKVADEKCADSTLMVDIESELGLSRKHLVAMALLLGCDYKLEGVKNVGKEQALRLMEELKNVDVLQRFEEWRSSLSLVDLREELDLTQRPVHCGRCSHEGNRPKHRGQGCEGCGTSKGCSPAKAPPCECEWHRIKHTNDEHSVEYKLRNLALADTDFPDKQVIDLYMTAEGCSSEGVQLHWTPLNFSGLQVYLQQHMNFDETHSAEKLLPLVTAYYLGEMQRSGKTDELPQLIPHSVLKERTMRGQAVAEVQWTHIEGVATSVPRPIVTMEPMRIMARCFPQFMGHYDLVQEQKHAAAKKRKRCMKPEETGARQQTMDKMFRVRKRLKFNFSEDKDESSSTDSEIAGPSHGAPTLTHMSGIQGVGCPVPQFDSMCSPAAHQCPPTPRKSAVRTLFKSAKRRLDTPSTFSMVKNSRKLDISVDSDDGVMVGLPSTDDENSMDWDVGCGPSTKTDKPASAVGSSSMGLSGIPGKVFDFINLTDDDEVRVKVFTGAAGERPSASSSQGASDSDNQRAQPEMPATCTKENKQKAPRASKTKSTKKSASKKKKADKSQPKIKLFLRRI